MQSRKLYSEDDVAFLTKNYGTLQGEELAKELGRPWKTLQKQASVLGITKYYTKNCLLCGKSFHPRNRRGRFCSDSCLQKWRRKAYPKIHESAKLACKRYGERFRNLWGISSAKNHLAKEVIECELFVSQNVLPKHGFTDILLTRQFSVYFPFDILARKDGNPCAINATFSYSKQLDPRLLPLIEFFSLRLFTCHVKPDFSKYYLIEVPRGHINSCCRGIFLEELRQ